MSQTLQKQRHPQAVWEQPVPRTLMGLEQVECIRTQQNCPLLKKHSPPSLVLFART